MQYNAICNLKNLIVLLCHPFLQQKYVYKFEHLKIFLCFFKKKYYDLLLLLLLLSRLSRVRLCATP